MSLVIDGTGSITGLTATGISAVQQLPAGSVLQVVQANYPFYGAITSTSFVTTNLTASITPKFATSKILVLVNPNIGFSYSSNNFASVLLQVTRGATQIFYSERAIAMAGGVGAGGNIFTEASLGLSVLDSPATTSSTTYTLNYAVSNGSVSARINDYNTTQSTNGSTITLMEIAG